MRYTIENNYIKLTVSSLGATITSFVHKNTNIDIVLGFDSEEEYLVNKSTYAGSTVGRNCNRIKDAMFSLNGNIYHLLKNDGNNNLHGGNGTSFSEFKLIEKDENSLTFIIDLKDGQDGFPGNMKLMVIYKIMDNKMRITYKALSDKDTIFNVTNHSYFNLNGGSANILNHEAKIYTDKVALNDSEGLSTEFVKDVDDTMFDFKDFRTYRENFEISDDNNVLGGIDHNYIFETMDNKQLVTIRNDQLVLNINSDYPDMHMYTGCFFEDIKGKYGNEYQKFHGVAFEPQFYPNSINYDKFLKPILKANQEVEHFIEYCIEERN